MGENYVKNLIFHNDGEIISYAALKGNEPLFEALLTHLNVANQEETRRRAYPNSTHTSRVKIIFTLEQIATFNSNNELCKL